MKFDAILADKECLFVFSLRAFGPLVQSKIFWPDANAYALLSGPPPPLMRILGIAWLGNLLGMGTCSPLRGFRTSVNNFYNHTMGTARVTFPIILLF